MFLVTSVSGFVMTVGGSLWVTHRQETRGWVGGRGWRATAPEVSELSQCPANKHVNIKCKVPWSIAIFTIQTHKRLKRKLINFIRIQTHNLQIFGYIYMMSVSSHSCNARDMSCVYIYK